MTTDAVPVGIPQSMLISKTVVLEASAAVGFVLYRHFQAKLHLRQARHRISFLREMQGRSLLDKLCKMGGVSVRSAASRTATDRIVGTSGVGSAVPAAATEEGECVERRNISNSTTAGSCCGYAYRVQLIPRCSGDFLLDAKDDLVVPLVSTAPIDTANVMLSSTVTASSDDDCKKTSQAAGNVSIHISPTFFAKLDYGNRLFSAVESLFLVYASVLGCPSPADPYVLVDLWNIINCVCQRFLVASLAHNASCLRDGGVGEIPVGWESAASLVQVLWNEYHIEKEPTVRRWLSEQPLMDEMALRTQVAVVPIFMPNEQLLKEVIRVVRSHQSRISLMKNGLRVLFQGVTSVHNILPLVAGVLALRIATEFNFGMGDVSASEGPREWATFRTQLSSGLTLSLDDTTRQAHPPSPLSRWWLAALRTAGAAVARGLQSVLEKSLRFASLNFLCALGETYLSETLALQLSGGLEGDIVMHVAAQDTMRLNSRSYTAALGALSSNSNLASYVVNWISSGAAFSKALLAARQFPAYFLAELLLHRSFTVLEKTFVSSLLTTDAVRDFYRKDELVSSAVPSNTMFGGRKTNNCLVDDESVTRDDDFRFARVERRFLLAAIPEEVKEAMPVERQLLASHHNSRKEAVVLQKLVDETGVLAVRSDAMLGLALLLRIAVFSTSSRCNEGSTDALRCPPSPSSSTTTLTMLVALAPVMEWPIDPRFGAESTVREILFPLQQEREAQGQRHRAAMDPLLLLPDSDIPALVRLLTLLSDERTKQQQQDRASGKTFLPVTTVPLTTEPGSTITLRQEEGDYVELPRISSATLKKDLLGALRNTGGELEVIKACALGSAYTLQSSTDTSSASHYAQMNFLTSFLGILKQHLVRSVGYWRYGAVFASQTPSQEHGLESASWRLGALVGHGGTGFQCPPSSHDGSGVELLKRRAAHIDLSNSTNFSEDGRGAIAYMMFQNLIRSRVRCIDRPFATTLGRIPPSSSSPSKSDAAASFSVEFCNVSKSFGHRKVLDGVSFTLRRGEFLGIVGATGSGKTTILNLLLRIYEPDDGVILVNRTPIAEIPVRMLRRRIAYVCQDFLSNGFDPTWSIEDNLALGDLSRENMEDAMASALWQSDAKSVVASKPLKMKTLAVPSQFSGGEVQRLVIARALMRDPKQTGLLVLDEATSALDGATEKLVVENMFGGRRLSAKSDRLSCIAVAHRLATLISADKILVLEGGKVVEQGSWHRLAKKKDSHFRKLLEQQTVRGEVLEDSVSDELSSSGMPSRTTTLSFAAESPMSGGAEPSRTAEASATGTSAAVRVVEALHAIAEGAMGDSVVASAELRAKARRALAALQVTTAAATVAEQ